MGFPLNARNTRRKKTSDWWDKLTHNHLHRILCRDCDVEKPVLLLKIQRSAQSLHVHEVGGAVLGEFPGGGGAPARAQKNCPGWTGETDMQGRAVLGVADMERWIERLGPRATIAVIVLRYPHLLKPFDYKKLCRDLGHCLSLWAYALLLALEPLVRLRSRFIALARFEDFLDHSCLLVCVIIRPFYGQVASDLYASVGSQPRRLELHKTSTATIYSQEKPIRQLINAKLGPQLRPRHARRVWI